MSLEAILFFIVAVIAVGSAAAMLTSRNAVHSALFLVVNFACVAFFYLMLNAPFLAMIQITVYAGAIMVLFMFVIMLLGAEKLGTGPVHYAWLAPLGSLLAAVFIVVAMFVIVNGKIGSLQPVPHDPELRVVHALPGAPALDIYMNKVKALKTLDYTQATEYVRVPPGRYFVNFYPACANGATCPDPIATNAKPVATAVFDLAPETSTIYVVAGKPAAPQVYTVNTTQDRSVMADETNARVRAINALPESAPVNLVVIDPATGTAGQTLVNSLPSGKVSDPVELPKGTYDLVWIRGADRVAASNDLRLNPKTAELIVLTQEANGAAIRDTSISVEPTLVAETFGSPQQIGISLLSTFLLPFELVSLLLLAAMVGAIILTREEVTRRVRERRVVTEGALRINRARAEAAQANVPQTNAESSAD